MSIETEIKIKLENPDEIRKKLVSLGAKFIDNQREFDIFFDIGEAGFRQSDQVGRLRLQGDKATLTYKGPRKVDEVVCEREEIETYVEDFEKMRKIIRGWGHKEGENSEKIRETFECEGIKILIDKVAFIGWWIELEGGKEKILKVANKLGLDMTKAEKRHYGEIYSDFCEKTGCPFVREMTFEKEKEWLRVKK